MSDKKIINISLNAILNDTITAKRIYGNSPIIDFVNRWSNGRYFSINMNTNLENKLTDLFEPMDLAYRSHSHAFCIFRALTLVNTDNKISTDNPTTLINRIANNLIFLSVFKSDSQIRISVKK